MQFDVIIPVYNALSQVDLCIQSVLKHSSVPYQLILINDGSEADTTEYLRELERAHPEIELIENESNLGFVQTVNKGLKRETSANYRLLLNSDTIVTSGWLEKIAACFESDPRIGIACPASNNAFNLSLTMQPGETIESFSKRVSGHPVDEYADITTAVGFCMAIRSELIDEVGAFDLAFQAGYGEESDFHFRVLCRGYRSVLVPNCFVYHEGDASFGADKQQLEQGNRPLFDQRWKVIYLNELERHDRIDPVKKLQKELSEYDMKDKKHDVLFILGTSKLFGGIVVVYEVINRLIEQGIDAGAVILTEPEDIHMSLLFQPYFITPDSFEEELPDSKAFVCTHFSTVPFGITASQKYPETKLSYLIQGYEGWFPGAKLEEVVRSYKVIPNRIVVSNWLGNMLDRWGYDSTTIPNGVDTKFFAPKQQSAVGDRLTLFTMLRQDPQGTGSIGLSVIERIRAKGLPIDVIAVGDQSTSVAAQRLGVEGFKSANRRDIRDFYQRSDVFMDCSIVQGFGLMGLEAMASGVAVIASKTGGVQEYANEENSLLCQLGDADAFVEALEQLLADRQLLANLKEQGRQTAAQFDWSEIAVRYADYFRDLFENGQSIGAEQHKALLDYYFSQLLWKERVEKAVGNARECFESELQDSVYARGALELLPENGHYEDLMVLQNSPAGAAMINLYESLRASQGRVAEYNEKQGKSPVNGELFSKVAGIVRPGLK